MPGQQAQRHLKQPAGRLRPGAVRRHREGLRLAERRRRRRPARAGGGRPARPARGPRSPTTPPASPRSRPRPTTRRRRSSPRGSTRRGSMRRGSMPRGSMRRGSTRRGSTRRGSTRPTPTSPTSSPTPRSATRSRRRRTRRCSRCRPTPDRPAETVSASTGNTDGFFYVRVQGHGDQDFDADDAFGLERTVTGGDGLRRTRELRDGPTPRRRRAADADTVIVTDTNKLGARRPASPSTRRTWPRSGAWPARPTASSSTSAAQPGCGRCRSRSADAPDVPVRRQPGRPRRSRASSIATATREQQVRRDRGRRRRDPVLPLPRHVGARVGEPVRAAGAARTRPPAPA